MEHSVEAVLHTAIQDAESVSDRPVSDLHVGELPGHLLDLLLGGGSAGGWRQLEREEDLAGVQVVHVEMWEHRPRDKGVHLGALGRLEAKELRRGRLRPDVRRFVELVGVDERAAVEKQGHL